jgi:predicted transcriptional regulator
MLRTALGVGQRSLARKYGVSSGYVSRLLAGKYRSEASADAPPPPGGLNA